MRHLIEVLSSCSLLSSCILHRKIEAGMLRVAIRTLHSHEKNLGVRSIFQCLLSGIFSSHFILELQAPFEDMHIFIWMFFGMNLCGWSLAVHHWHCLKARVLLHKHLSRFIVICRAFKEHHSFVANELLSWMHARLFVWRAAGLPLSLLNNLSLN